MGLKKRLFGYNRKFRKNQEKSSLESLRLSYEINFANLKECFFKEIVRAFINGKEEDFNGLPG